MRVIKKIGVIISAFVLVFTLLPSNGTGFEAPLFHGFSSNNELVMSISDELLWLAPNDDVPTFSVPTTNVFFHPGADFIYFTIDTQIWMTDFDHKELIPITGEFSQPVNIQATKNLLLINNNKGSSVFINGELIFTKPFILSIDSAEGNTILLTIDGEDGAVVVDYINKSILGEINSGSTFGFVDDKIVLINNEQNTAFICSSDFLSKTALPGNSLYYLKNNHLFAHSQDNDYIINIKDPGKKLELPQFKYTHTNQNLLLGVRENGDLETLELPTLKKISGTQAINGSFDWTWFKSYPDYTIASFDDQGAVIDNVNGKLAFTKCKPVSSAGDTILCSSNGEHCLFNTFSSTTTALDNFQTDSLCIVSNSDILCNVLSVNGNSKQILTINKTTGDIQNNQTLSKETFLAGVPHSTFLTTKSRTLDSGTIQLLRNSGFTQATSIFTSNNSSSDSETDILVYHPDKIIPVVYHCPVPHSIDN